MSQFLSKSCSQTPVTALISYEELIISGQGPYIHVHHQSTSRLLASVQCLDEQAIHGLRVFQPGPSSFSVIIWGGKSLKVISITTEPNQDDPTNFHVFFHLNRTIVAQDWILDVAARPVDVSFQNFVSLSATLVTAQNALYSVNVQESLSSDPETLGHLSVDEMVAGRKCILYSAHLKWISATEVLVASGTAFGEIIVWSCSLTEAKPSIHTHFTFTGHEGSIFGVQISDLIESPFTTARRLLTSCSDDRTIRAWDISTIGFESDLSISPELTSTQESIVHETGFPVNLPDQQHSNCLAVAIGHVSRIWDIRYLYARAGEPENHVVTIVSVGEDGTSQIWALRNEVVIDSGAPIFHLTHLSSSAHHLGKNVWSVAATERPATPGSSSLLTGGADGRIVSRNPVPTRTDDKLFVERNITTVLQNIFNLPATKPISSEISRKASKATADYFRSYAYVTQNELLVTTNNGLVLLETYEEQSTGECARKWQQIALLDELKGYSVVSSIPEAGLAFLGGAKGSLYCFTSSTKSIELLAKTGCKIAGIFPCHVDSSRTDGVAVLLTYLGNFDRRLFWLRPSATGWVVSLSDDFAVSSLQQNTQFSQSSCALVSYVNEKIIVFVGYRDGRIRSLTRLDDGGVVTSIVNDAHGREAVTAMHWVPSTFSRTQITGDSAQYHGWLFSVGRDGVCAVHSFKNDQRSELNLVHKLSLPFGPNIEGIYVTPSTNDVYAYGFHGKQFVVYNISISDYILNIDCGGAHRMWNFDPRHNSAGQIVGGNLAWTKASKLNSQNIIQASHEIVQKGGHGREIKACAIATISANFLGPLIATGAEDTDICIFDYNDSGFSCVSTLRKHVTGIQSLQWSENGKYLFSCGGYEEFFVWRVRSVPGIKVGVAFESACPIDTERSDLRVMGFAIKERSRIGNDLESSAFDIAMMYSNSVIKTWRYNTDHKNWTILSAGQYTSACLTQVAYLDQDTSTIIMTAATDGHLAIWQESQLADNSGAKLLKCLKTQALHQNSIKTLSSCSLQASTTFVVTGGDDNAFGLSLISVNESDEVRSDSLLIPRAHAAAVTASHILICNPSDISPLCFQVLVATASNDQRLKLWGIEIDLRKDGVEGVNVKRVANKYTAIADVSSMALYPDTEAKQDAMKILVCGVGMEIWNVEI